MQIGEEIKREEARGEEEEDRISSLPLQLRAAIVSLLPVEEAVRTTVLSKSWTNVCIHFDRLNLIMNSVTCDLSRMRDVAQPFKQLLESLARLNVGIRSLSLSQVRGVNLRQLQRPVDVHPPGWSLFSGLLEVLQLRDAKLSPASALPFQRCANLTTIKLSKVVVGVHMLEAQIFPNCKALESMSFSCCILLGVRKPSPESSRPLKKARIWVPFSISAPMNLKSLELDRVQLSGRDNTLSIKAPGLIDLKLHSPYFSYSTKVDEPEISLALDAPQLVALQVVTNVIHKLDVHPYPAYGYSYVKYHLTSTHILHLFLTSPLQGGSQFGRLRSLSSDVDLNDPRDVALLWSILKLSPCLERLYINIPHKEEKQVGITKKINYQIQSHAFHISGDPEELDDYTFPCLKSIKVRFYTENEREQVHHFLTSLRQKAPNMHQVEVLPVISKT